MDRSNLAGFRPWVTRFHVGQPEGYNRYPALEQEIGANKSEFSK